MQSHRSEQSCVAAYTEAGDLTGWCHEDEARDMIRAGRATVQSDRPGRHRITMLADVAAPLTGAARARAVAGYFGTVKYTYHEDIGLNEVIGHQVMLKRYCPSTGQFRRW